MPTRPQPFRLPQEVQARQRSQQQRDAERGTASQRGYDARWQRTAHAFLHQHPLCMLCLAARRLTPATVVDHVVPHRGDRDRFWDEANWQALCKPCHDAKTRRGQ